MKTPKECEKNHQNITTSRIIYKKNKKKPYHETRRGRRTLSSANQKRKNQKNMYKWIIQ
jgi:hypothetical protein